MADVTGGTPPTNASPFAVPADLTAVYDHFGDAEMFTVATAGALPGSGNWAGRKCFVQADKSLRIWDGSAWLVITELNRSATTVTPESSYYNVVTSGSWGALSVYRNGPMVQLTGHISIDGNTGTDSTWAYIPAGFRPVARTSIQLRGLTADGTLRAYVSTSGDLVVQSNVTTGAASYVANAVWLVP